MSRQQHVRSRTKSVQFSDNLDSQSHNSGSDTETASHASADQDQLPAAPPPSQTELTDDDDIDKLIQLSLIRSFNINNRHPERSLSTSSAADEVVLSAVSAENSSYFAGSSSQTDQGVQAQAGLGLDPLWDEDDEFIYRREGVGLLLPMPTTMNRRNRQTNFSNAGIQSFSTILLAPLLETVQHEKLLVVGLCVLWYVVSSGTNLTGKYLLSSFPYPLTMTMVQLFCISSLSSPFFRYYGLDEELVVGWSYYLQYIVPLAFGKFISSVFSHISIWKVPVSYAHTVKASMPLFTVIFARIILNERHTLKVYLSLIPIIFGIGIATLTELSFNFTGLFSAIVATAGFSLQNLFSKKVLHETGVHHLKLLHVLGKLSFFMFLPVWFYLDFFSLLEDDCMKLRNFNTLGLLAMCGCLSWLQNIIAFSVLSLVTPLSYAVCNASKRIFIIASSLLVMGNPVSIANVIGMFLAIVGVFCYNKAKYDSRSDKKKQPPLLPYAEADKSRNGFEVYRQNGNLRNDFGKTPIAYNVINLNSVNNNLVHCKPKSGQGNVLFV